MSLPNSCVFGLTRSVSLDGCGLDSETFSRVLILLFCSFNTTSTLKNPAQQNTIDKTERMLEIEGISCFWVAMLATSTSYAHAANLQMQTLLNTAPDVIYCSVKQGHSLATNLQNSFVCLGVSDHVR